MCVAQKLQEMNYFASTNINISENYISVFLFFYKTLIWK